MLTESSCRTMVGVLLHYWQELSIMRVVTRWKTNRRSSTYHLGAEGNLLVSKNQGGASEWEADCSVRFWYPHGE